MQPDEKRRTKRQAGISRARVMLKKHVGWLPGYPVKTDGNLVRWQSMRWDGSGYEQSWLLSGSELRQAQMTITKLRYHFPKALPKIVDDVEDWLARMDFVLDLLKSVIHDRQANGIEQILSAGLFPSRWIDRFVASRQQHPRLAPLFDAICHLELSKRRRADTALIDWIDSQADNLASLDSKPQFGDVLSLQLRFSALREAISGPIAENLVRAYADPLIRDCPIQDGFARVDWLQKAIAKRIVGSQANAAPQQNSETVIQQIDPLLNTIHLEKPKRQKALLALLNLLVCKETLNDIHQLKTRIDSCDRRRTRLIRLVNFGSLTIPSS